VLSWHEGEAANYQEAETHFQQALHLSRKAEASRGTLCGAAARAESGKLADKAAPQGLYDMLDNRGQLYSLKRKNSDELQVYQEALDEVRGDIANASSPQLQEHLSRIFTPNTPSINMTVKLPMRLKETRASAPLQKLY